LDRNRIAIRERGYLEILDLTLCVIRAYAGSLAAALAVGVVPAMLLNAWLLSAALDADPGAPFPALYLWLMFLLVLWEAPLVTAPVTLCLGQALFSEQVESGRIARNFAASLPQLILYQVLWRGLLVPCVITWFVPFVRWPYLNEVILLERNPLFRGRGRRMTTSRRRWALHSGSGGELFSQWVIAALVGVMLFLSVWGSLHCLAALMLDEREGSMLDYTLYYPLALWTTVGFYAVLRFLGYLDLRIRREGWEVELMMRAEGARLERQLL
jgi:hypothetical protein